MWLWSVLKNTIQLLGTYCDIIKGLKQRLDVLCDRWSTIWTYIEKFLSKGWTLHGSDVRPLLCEDFRSMLSIYALMRKKVTLSSYLFLFWQSYSEVLLSLGLKMNLSLWKWPQFCQNNNEKNKSQLCKLSKTTLQRVKTSHRNRCSVKLIICRCWKCEQFITEVFQFVRMDPASVISKQLLSHSCGQTPQHMPPAQCAIITLLLIHCF